jgi:hypothetical protein
MRRRAAAPLQLLLDPTCFTHGQEEHPLREIRHVYKLTGARAAPGPSAQRRRKPATGLDVLTTEPIAEPDGSPGVVRHTAAERHTEWRRQWHSSADLRSNCRGRLPPLPQRGGQHGYDFEDWIDAERALRARRLKNSNSQQPTSKRVPTTQHLGGWALVVGS